MKHELPHVENSETVRPQDAAGQPDMGEALATHIPVDLVRGNEDFDERFFGGELEQMLAADFAGHIAEGPAVRAPAVAPASVAKPVRTLRPTMSSTRAFPKHPDIRQVAADMRGAPLPEHRESVVANPVPAGDDVEIPELDGIERPLQSLMWTQKLSAQIEEYVDEAFDEGANTREDLVAALQRRLNHEDRQQQRFAGKEKIILSEAVLGYIDVRLASDASRYINEALGDGAKTREEVLDIINLNVDLERKYNPELEDITLSESALVYIDAKLKEKYPGLYPDSAPVAASAPIKPLRERMRNAGAIIAASNAAGEALVNALEHPPADIIPPNPHYTPRVPDMVEQEARKKLLPGNPDAINQEKLLAMLEDSYKSAPEPAAEETAVEKAAVEAPKESAPAPVATSAPKVEPAALVAALAPGAAAPKPVAPSAKPVIPAVVTAPAVAPAAAASVVTPAAAGIKAEPDFIGPRDERSVEQRLKQIGANFDASKTTIADVLKNLGESGINPIDPAKLKRVSIEESVAEEQAAREESRARIGDLIERMGGISTAGPMLTLPTDVAAAPAAKAPEALKPAPAKPAVKVEPADKAKPEEPAVDRSNVVDFFDRSRGQPVLQPALKRTSNVAPVVQPDRYDPVENGENEASASQHAVTSTTDAPASAQPARSKSWRRRDRKKRRLLEQKQQQAKVVQSQQPKQAHAAQPQPVQNPQGKKHNGRHRNRRPQPVPAPAAAAAPAPAWRNPLEDLKRAAGKPKPQPKAPESQDILQELKEAAGALHGVHGHTRPPVKPVPTAVPENLEELLVGAVGDVLKDSAPETGEKEQSQPKHEPMRTAKGDPVGHRRSTYLTPEEGQGRAAEAARETFHASEPAAEEVTPPPIAPAQRHVERVVEPFKKAPEPAIVARPADMEPPHPLG